MKRGRIPKTSDPTTLMDVADSLDEDAKNFERIIKLNPHLQNEGQVWAMHSLQRHAKKLRTMARTLMEPREGSRSPERADLIGRSA